LLALTNDERARDRKNELLDPAEGAPRSCPPALPAWKSHARKRRPADDLLQCAPADAGDRKQVALR